MKTTGQIDGYEFTIETGAQDSLAIVVIDTKDGRKMTLGASRDLLEVAGMALDKLVDEERKARRRNR